MEISKALIMGIFFDGVITGTLLGVVIGLWF